jgi:hypothetical protein
MIDGYITGEDGEVSVLSADDSVKIVQEFTPDGTRALVDAVDQRSHGVMAWIKRHW